MSRRPICKIAQETGEVPLSCLFGCKRNCVIEHQAYEADMREMFDDPEPPMFGPHCKTCGATDVRWRQQGGGWVLFSLQPGVIHACPPDELLKDFD